MQDGLPFPDAPNQKIGDQECSGIASALAPSTQTQDDAGMACALGWPKMPWELWEKGTWGKLSTHLPCMFERTVVHQLISTSVEPRSRF